MPFRKEESPPWLIVSAVCAFGYLATIRFQPFALSLPLKVLAILSLALMAWSAGSRAMSAALAVFSVGDGLFDDARRSALFVPGVLTFVAGHLIYAGYFSRYWDRPLRIWEHQRVLLALVFLYSAGFTAWMWQSLGALAIPGLIYTAAMAAMAFSVILARVPWQVLAGLILFIAADSLIAIGKFKGPVPFEQYVVWITYYGAQYGLSRQAGEGKPGGLLR